MDIDLERRVNEAIEQLRMLSVEYINLSLLDPVAKMMLVALVNEVQKIQDYKAKIGRASCRERV